jgi:hypothetical protein
MGEIRIRTAFSDTDGRVVLKWILKPKGEKLDCLSLGYDQIVDYCENGSKHSGSLKLEKFF